MVNVFIILRRWYGLGWEYDHLLGEACVGLWHLIVKFDVREWALVSAAIRRQLAGVASKLYGYNVVTISRSTHLQTTTIPRRHSYHLKASFTSRSLCSIFKICHSLLTTQGGSPSRLLLQLRLLWTILATSSICAERRFRHGERHRIRRDGCGFGYWSRPPRQRRASSK